MVENKIWEGKGADMKSVLVEDEKLGQGPFRIGGKPTNQSEQKKKKKRLRTLGGAESSNDRTGCKGRQIRRAWYGV